MSASRSRSVWHVYIVRCADDSLYTGMAKDVVTRVEMHNEGTGAKYTRSRRPVTLLYVEAVGEQTCAMKRERQIKSMATATKLRLIEI